MGKDVNGNYVRENDYSNSNRGHMTSGMSSMSSMIVLFHHRLEHLPIPTEICVLFTLKVT